MFIRSNMVDEVSDRIDLNGVRDPPRAVLEKRDS